MRESRRHRRRHQLDIQSSENSLPWSDRNRAPAGNRRCPAAINRLIDPSRGRRLVTDGKDIARHLDANTRTSASTSPQTVRVISGCYGKFHAAGQRRRISRIRAVPCSLGQKAHRGQAMSARWKYSPNSRYRCRAAHRNPHSIRRNCPATKHQLRYPVFCAHHRRRSHAFPGVLMDRTSFGAFQDLRAP